MSPLLSERQRPRPLSERPAESRNRITLFYVVITYNDVMSADNPFVYGEIVTAAAFADREEERARLGRDLAAGQKVFLISPRRYGKSSLVRDVHARAGAAEDPHRRGHRRLVQLLHRLPRVLRPGAGRRRHAGQPAAALGRRAAAAPSGRSCASMPIRPAAPSSRSRSPRCGRRATRPASPRRCSRCPAALPRHAGSGWPLPSTSSRRLPSFDGGSVEHALRAAVQEQRQVGYVFSGSEPSLMERMLGPRRPFYKAGPVMRLEKINPRRLRHVHRRAVPGQRHQARTRPRRGHRRSRRERALRRAAPRPRDLGRRQGGGTEDRGRGGSARHADAAARRTAHGVRGIVAAIDAAAARGAARAGARGRTRADVGRCAGPASAAGHVHGAGGARGAASARTSSPRIEGRYVAVDSLYREWVARKTF